MSDIYLGDCREVRSVLADNSIDTIITDPPYGLEFMGKGWDKGAPGVEFWKEFLAVTKPGGMLLAFGGTRTYHRMVCAIEDAGWEIRDCMMWLYGQGFPKSLDISKAIDKAKGAERPVVGKIAAPRSNVNATASLGGAFQEAPGLTAPATDLAKQWNGWGTALKPAWEPIIVAMKPTDGTFAENAEKWGVAGINIHGSRIGTEELSAHGGGQHSIFVPAIPKGSNPHSGRWPANLILDEEAAGMLDEQSGHLHPSDNKSDTGNGNDKAYDASSFQISYAGRAIRDYGNVGGGASRFFYCAKASKSERNAGCEGLPDSFHAASNGAKAALARGETYDKSVTGINTIQVVKNGHPTVKPLKLMEYLCTLTKTPTGGIVLDPFAGSGTTLLAAKNTGREYIGIEQNPEYFEIIKARLGLK